MFLVLMKGAHCADSVFRSAAISAELEGDASAPEASSAALTESVESTRRSAAPTRATSAEELPLGANRAFQLSASTPGSAISSKVFTCGKRGWRRGPVM